MARTGSGSGNAFNPKVVLAMLLFGALAFVAMLYLIGSGQTGGNTNDGGGHAGGKGLNGYAALAGMLEEQGYAVSRSRTQSTLSTDSLLILTPPTFADPEELSQIINDRRWSGPTLVILPKWNAFQAPVRFGSDAKEGWVILSGSSVPAWSSELDFELDPSISDSSTGWSGLGLSGGLPDPKVAMGSQSGMLVPLVRGQGGAILAGYADDDGYYPVLAQAAGVPSGDGDYLDSDKWGVTFVVEPDLLNNYGLADSARAQLASALIETAMEGEDLPIVFDLTLNGLGASQNLLTLAFTPPFLAATLCLMLAMIVIAWRAFRRFGPPVSEGRAIAFGKARLVKNSAGFIQRSKRLHLLSQPYADMMRERIVHALALRKPDDDAIDAALHKRVPGAPLFSASARQLRAARHPNEILRAAAALKSIERMLNK
ncbi:DUF4350 domain-containing protein [Pontixanthobacter aquaemixtae]|uniref:DUF4350 domain-containing protein n=1 Tax=Pontixanthobacter aquaemixtae TaxID=1958940 RepID=A0A844ZUX6_9SPHN|nr:DUF4350 domain-containing protein [Pontixanthobacter aquaemixtae]MXO91803.1 DUF4350 domain-containing protein [Pontixanthobacter aquaemixtae]